MVQYQIFCRYLNENTGKIVSNSSKKEWISAEEWHNAKIAYNVEDPSQSNALTITQDSLSTGIKAGSTYKALYNEILKKMNNHEIDKNKRLHYDDLSIEEQTAYNLCNRFLEIKNLAANDLCVIEYANIRPVDQMSGSGNGQSRSKDMSNKRKEAKTTDSELYEIVYDQSSNKNEKYDMLFSYAGIKTTNEQFDYYKIKNSFKKEKHYKRIGEPPVECFNKYDSSIASNWSQDEIKTNGGLIDFIPNLMYEKMERIKMQPWFLITTVNSLQAAMTKAKELVNIYGKDAVKIGKVVPLEQYIEIV